MLGLSVMTTGAVAAGAAGGWKQVSIEEFGAVGDNHTDCTHAFRSALLAVKESGGEVLVPADKIYQTAPINLTSNVVLRVEGTMRAVEDRDKFPKIGILPSVGHDYDTNSQCRRMPFVFAVGGSNITITGSGVIDAAGRYWWQNYHNHSIDPRVGRPHLMEIQSVTGLEITGVTLLDSGFWTLHPYNCKDVWIHDMTIQAPDYKAVGGGAPNGDGIDVDSCQNVLIEHNHINCGDDHVTILSGTNGKGAPSKNITVRHNRLGTGMGISVGSSVAGGVEDVVYQYNWMNQSVGEWGIGVHIKTRVQYGGYIRNIAYLDNYFETAGVPGGAIHIESGYQSSGQCNKTGLPGACTAISDIVFRNLTFANAGGAGVLQCFPDVPCQNITAEDVHITAPSSNWGCSNVASGTFKDVKVGPKGETAIDMVKNCNLTWRSGTQ